MMTDNITVTITTPSDREAVVTREFNAPAALVFDAVTKAELLKRWYGFPMPLDSCESDPRLGGSWRLTFTVQGKQMGKYGVYKEFDPPRRFVRSEQWLGTDMPAGETIMTVDLVERSGRTMLTQHFLFPSKEMRDMSLKVGLTQQGMSAFYARLDELLGSIA